MRKIPTLFMRDDSDRRYVTANPTLGCEWVLAGEGIATRKWDGTCVYFDSERWWARREVKPGKTQPEGFVPVEHDPVTGKTVGWEPAEQSSFARYIAEATKGRTFEPWTYELVGPKINGNPEHFPHHTLVPHGNYQVPEAPRDYLGLRWFLLAFSDWEGLVFWHPNGDMAKIKRRDFRQDPTP